MFVFEGDNLNSLYVELINSLIKRGQEIVKEGRKIKGLYPCVIKITNQKKGILVVKGRACSPAFAIVEAIWNLTADSKPETEAAAKSP